jgi:membrane protein
MRSLRRAWPVLTTAVRSYRDDRVPMMGAALAYYMVFSIAPLLVISMGLAGLFFGDQGGREILDAISGVAGSAGALALAAMVKGAASRPHAGYVATVVGVITLLIGASGVFGQLQDSLNTIWKVQLAPDAPWTTTVRRRLLSFGMVGVIAFIMLASLLVTAGLSAAGKFLSSSFPGGAASWQALNALLSLAVVTGLFGLIFKVLPDARLRWRDALRGGFWTGMLFIAGQYAIGLYLGRAGVASAYGAVGSVVALLVWVYWSAQIVLFGAELTRAYGLSLLPFEGPRPDRQEEDRHARQHVQVRRHLRERGSLRHHRARRVD